MTSSTPRRARTTGAVVLTTATLMAFGLGAANAHVSVAPTSTTENGYAQLTFSVPNESDTASTTTLEVQLPTEQPFTSVRVKPIEGWDAEVVTGELPEPVTTADGATLTEAPLSVRWTAEEGSEIAPQQYQTFSISVGQLPEAGTTVMLPATQSYTDGEVVEWDDETVEGEAEPDKPAPSFVTTAAAEGEDSHGGAAPEATGEAAETAEATAPAEAADTEQTASTSDDDSASAVGWIGLVAGLLGLVAGVVALLRTRRTA
ncbi:YcnI family protein [uncultured Arthrobacter sp.]|uniref:YcnI family copper-binding membrane protein n=1 Tax=uncultured Arthrobacter sp. TaxID=114050 RepID=UPI00263173E7|nr:YcnI family protein [uncultured Arthrobacter sp.]